MDLKFPMDGDNLFDFNGPRHHIVPIHTMYDDNWTIYADGYRRAADVILQQASQGASPDNFIIYPIIFLYRHYVELRLKEILKDGCPLLDESTDPPCHHELTSLWRECRRIAERVWPNGDAAPLDATGKIIGQIAEHDATSFAFRYPVDTKLKPTLPDLSCVNLTRFAEVIGKLANLLDAMSFGIEKLLRDKREAESEFFPAEFYK